METQPDWAVLGGQLALGTLLGIAIGFTLKKAFKVGLVVIGVLVLGGLALQHFDIITIHWATLESVYVGSVEQSGGFFAMAKQWAESLGGLIPVAGSFVVGFFIGLRAG